MSKSGSGAIVLRPAVSADVAVITAIYAEAVRGDTATFEIDPPAEAEMARRIALIDALGHPLFVGEINGLVAGYAYASTFRARPAFNKTVEDSIYVAREAQRQGLGRALLAKLIDNAATSGFCQMIAVIGDSSTKEASIALHAALGFRHMGALEKVGRKHEQWLDIVFMQRGL